MPFEHEKLADGGLQITAAGELKGSDLIALNQELYATPEQIRAITYQLCDFTRVDGVRASAEEIRKLAAQDRAAGHVNQEMLIAVVGSDDVVFGLARMWQAQAESSPFETQVFRTMEQARAWIDGRLSGRRKG